MLGTNRTEPHRSVLFLIYGLHLRLPRDGKHNGSRSFKLGSILLICIRGGVILRARSTLTHSVRHLIVEGGRGTDNVLRTS